MIDPAALADLAIETWRLQRKLRRAAIPEEVKGALARSAGRIAESLADLGVRTEDPEGQPFREGMSWDVASFEPPGEVVRETLRPAVYLFDHLARLAQVIVGPQPADTLGPGTPQKGPESEENND